MPRFKTKGHALGRLPAWRPTARGVVWRSGVQAKAGDHGEGVAVSSIHRDPFPGSAATVCAQVSRTQRRGNKAGARQRVGNSGGAVITAVIEVAMAAAVSIRFRAQLISRPDGAFDSERCVYRRQGQSPTEPRFVPRSGWSGGGKRTGKSGLRRHGKNRGAKNKFSNRNLHEVFNQRLLCEGVSRIVETYSTSFGNEFEPALARVPISAIGTSRKVAPTSILLLLKRGNFFFGPAHLGFSAAAQGQKFFLPAQIQERRFEVRPLSLCRGRSRFICDCG